MSVGDLFRDNSEKLRLVGYFVVVIAVAAPLFSSLGKAYENRSDLFRQLIQTPGALGIVSVEQLSAFLFGVFLGLLLLLILDPKKRVQGLLLGFGTVSALVALQSQDLFVTNIDFVATSPVLVGGLVLGGIVGGGRNLFQIQTADALEFRRAASLLFFILSTITVVGLIEYHLSFPQIINPVFAEETVDIVIPNNPAVEFNSDGLAQNIVLSAVFIITLRSFFQYDSSEDFFILGPVGSGKSLFLVGKYLEALDEAADRDADTPMTPSADLMELVSEVDAASEDAGWELGATAVDDVSNLEFNYVKGSVFPKNIRIGSLDYAGEYLDQLPNALTSEPEEIDDSILRRLAQRVREANTLVLILDMERYESDESLGIESYFDILDATDSTKVLLVATKCDVLAEEFRDEMGLDPVMYFDEFREYVNETITQNDQTVRTLVQDTAGSEIYPVYYQTTERNGERVPMRDANGNVQTMGFNELLERMG
jgi:GTPase SAR1 family protein